MATNGRPPKPVEQKRRLGNPGQRPLPDRAAVVALVPADSSPPAHLRDDGARMWDEIMSVAQWVSVTDQKTLVELCELVQNRTDMHERVKADGLVLVAPNGAYQAHPLLSHIRDVSKQIHGLMSLFGLTPADRTRIGLGEVQRVSKLDALRKQQQQKQANNADL